MQVVTELRLGEIYDLVVLGLKAPALSAALETIRPAVGPQTLILPLLNGMDHLKELEQAFPGRTIGGLVKIVATLDQDGVIQQMTPLCTMTIGPIDGRPLSQEVIDTLTVTGFTLSVDDEVLTRLWEKWVFIAAAGIITCLFRGNVGNILAAGGKNQILSAIEETENVASGAGHPVSREEPPADSETAHRGRTGVHVTALPGPRTGRTGRGRTHPRWALKESPQTGRTYTLARGDTASAAQTPEGQSGNR